MGLYGTLACLLGGFFSLLSLIGALWMDCWQVNSKGSVVLSLRCRGLWGECVWDKFVKIWTCDVFGSYLNPQPEAILVTRIAAIVSAIAAAAALLCLLCGCQYFQCLSAGIAKRHWLLSSVGFSLVAGLSSCVGVTRYGIYVFAQHQYEVSLRIPGFPSFEYGASLWLAVAGNLSAFFAAGASYLETAAGTTSPEAGPGTSLPGKSAGTYV
ncbi:claudin-16-like [Anolis carolinensis]|uniref:claudin-16-like n=1 Tax=Anolis carolinensis TaxID=28377 RepID=UPI002F2B34F2